MKKLRIFIIALAFIFLMGCGGTAEKKEETAETKVETTEKKEETKEETKEEAKEEAKDGNKFIGKWVIFATTDADGKIFASTREEATSVEMAIEIKEDNTVVATYYKLEPDQGSWEKKDDDTIIIDLEGDKQEFTIEDELLTGKSPEGAMYFFLDGSEPSAKEKELIENAVKE